MRRERRDARRDQHAERREQHRGSDHLADRRDVREHAALEQDQRERDRARIAHEGRVVELDAARPVLAEQHPEPEEQQQRGGPEPIDEAGCDRPDQQHRDRDEQGLWDVQRCLLVGRAVSGSVPGSACGPSRYGPVPCCSPPSRAPRAASSSTGARCTSAGTGCCSPLGVLFGSAIARRELRRRSIDPDLTYAVALWVVPFGLVGARLYHVATDWSTRFAGHWERIPQVWEGGLGIYGALLGGMLGGAIAARRYGIALPVLLDCIAPGTALAQALGRFGNYFNQELFGGPTKLPWGLEISLPNRPPGYDAVRDVPADVPVRVALVPARGRRRAVRVAARLAAAPGRSAAVPLPGALLGGALLRRGAADRSRARDRAAAAEPGRGGGRVLVAGSVFVLLARRGGPPRLSLGIPERLEPRPSGCRSGIPVGRTSCVAAAGSLLLARGSPRVRCVRWPFGRA